MKNHNLSISPHLAGLLCHYRQLDPQLPPAFNDIVIDMLQGREFTTIHEYIVPLSEYGVMDTSFWLSKGYGYSQMTEEDKEGMLSDVVNGIFKQEWTMLDPSGFFNDVPTKFVYRIAKGSTVIPFSRADFDLLVRKLPEVQALTNKILSIKHNREQRLRNMMRMKGKEKRQEFERIFGMEVYQYFDRQDIARYLGFSPEHFCRL